MGSQPYLLVNTTVKKVNKVIKSNIKKANPYNNINELNNGYKSTYLNNSKNNKDEFSFASININKLKLILYQDIIIFAIQVRNYIVLTIFIIIIHRKGED